MAGKAAIDNLNHVYAANHKKVILESSSYFRRWCSTFAIAQNEYKSYLAAKNSLQRVKKLRSVR